jgi:hypothetical protein
MSLNLEAMRPRHPDAPKEPLTQREILDTRAALDREYRKVSTWRSAMTREEFEYGTLPWWRRPFRSRPTGTDSGGLR